MKILVTDSAGFIGSALVLRLLARGDTIIGIDNNNYFDPALKEARLTRHAKHPSYTHLRIDLADSQAIQAAFKTHQPQRVVNLAAQAGVHYSIENPLAYIDSNIVGIAHVLESCRHNSVEHLVYASISSVYGANTTMPFSMHHNRQRRNQLIREYAEDPEYFAEVIRSRFIPRPAFPCRHQIPLVTLQPR